MERLQILLASDLGEDLGFPGDPGVREHDVQTAVFFEALVHDRFHCGFVAGVERAGVDFNRGVEGVQLAFVGFEVRGGEVADIDCFCAVLGELVG